MHNNSLYNAFIICVERLLHIGSHFSLRKWRRRPHFPTKLAAAASFSYKIGGGGLIFQQNWRQRQGFGNITGGCSDMVWILAWCEESPRPTLLQTYKGSYDKFLFFSFLAQVEKRIFEGAFFSCYSRIFWSMKMFM